MSHVSQCHEPGLLLVLTRPRSVSCLKDFHDWYNTEHGPSRMKLDFIRNGYRYKTADEEPVWAGIYDLTRVSAVTESQYTNLRKHRSAREQDVMNNKLDVLQRRVYKLLTTRGSCETPAPVMLRVSFVVKQELASEVHQWYEQEHINDIACIPGWRRSRRFIAIDGDKLRSDCVELLAIHEFDEDNGLGGPQHMLGRSRPWRNKIVSLVESRSNEEFHFHHAFHAQNYRQPPDLPQDELARSHDAISDMHSGLNAADKAGLNNVVSRVMLPAVS